MAGSTGLSAAQRRALDRLSVAETFDQYCLVGGSAVAWHFGHRRSEDLDLFSIRSDAEPERLVGSITGARLLDVTDVIVRALIDRVPVDVVRYPYAPIDALQAGPHGIAIAGVRDLAAMKVAAIARRGLRRDFWDLQVIAQHGTLGAAIDAYREKFGPAAADVYPVLRALTWFEDAEAEGPLPRGLSARGWSRIKAFFLHGVPPLLAGSEWR